MATAKTPAQVDEEAQQKVWEDNVVDTLNLVIKNIPNLPEGDIDARATIYRELLGLKGKVAQCGPAVRKVFNRAVNTLYADLDAIPGSMYLSEEEPKP